MNGSHVSNSILLAVLLSLFMLDLKTDAKSWSTGNMWGLLERTVAVECLATVAGELKKSKADLQGLLPASEYSSLETFFSRTVEAAGAFTLHVRK